MVEVREDGSIPGPDVYGRVYRLVDPDTGAVGFSMWASDLPESWIGPHIEQYDSFSRWMSDVINVADARALTLSLNNEVRGTFESTPMTRLRERVEMRVSTLNADVVDGFTVLDDLASIFKQL